MTLTSVDWEMDNSPLVTAHNLLVSFRSSRLMKPRLWCSQYPAMPVRDGPHYKIITLTSLYVLQHTHISHRATTSLSTQVIWGSLSGGFVAFGRKRWAKWGRWTGHCISPLWGGVESSSQSCDEPDGSQRASLPRRTFTQNHQSK